MQIYSTVLQYISLVSLELSFLFVRCRELTEAGPVTVLPVPRSIALRGTSTGDSVVLAGVTASPEQTVDVEKGQLHVLLPGSWISLRLEKTCSQEAGISLSR